MHGIQKLRWVLERLQWDLESQIWQHAQLLKVEKNVWGSVYEAEECRILRVLSSNQIVIETSAIDD